MAKDRARKRPRRLFSPQRPPPLTNRQLTTTPILNRGLNVFSQVNPLDALISLLAVFRQRQSDRIAIGGVHQLNAARFGNRRTTRRTTNVGLDDEIFTGATDPVSFPCSRVRDSSRSETVATSVPARYRFELLLPGN